MSLNKNSYIFLIVLFFLNDVFAQLAFSRNSRTFETTNSSLFVKGLAHACLGQLDFPDSLPCNPAVTALNKKASLNAELLLSNGYSNLQSVRSLLSGQYSQDLIDTFFSKDKVIQIEASVNINFVSRYFNAQYEPLSVKAFSVVRNEANPEIDFYSVEEQGFTFQSGHVIFDNFYLGLQTRFLDRKYIKNRFKLTTLATQAGRDALAPKKQTITFLEPGALWQFDHEWKPRLSLLLANAGFFSTDDSAFKDPVELQAGFAVSPPAYWGEMDINLDYKNLSYEEKEWWEKFRLGFLYKFGTMYFTSGIDPNGISSGIFYGLDKFNAGVLYSTTRYIKDNDNYYTQTVYVQLGWQI